MYSGVKTKHQTLGYDSNINHDDVESMWTAKKVDSIAKLAIQAGKEAGTTVQIMINILEYNWEIFVYGQLIPNS